MDQLCEEQHLDITIDESEIVDGAKEIIKKIRPTWPLDKLHFKVKHFIKYIATYIVFFYIHIRTLIYIYIYCKRLILCTHFFDLL